MTTPAHSLSNSTQFLSSNSDLFQHILQKSNYLQEWKHRNELNPQLESSTNLTPIPLTHIDSLDATEMASYIDHTVLSATCTEKQIQTLCQEALEFKFMAVCVNPCHVDLAKKETQGSSVAVAAVVGFPLGQNLQETKLSEAKSLLQMGVQELDIVMNVGKLLDGDYGYVISELQQVQQEASKAGAIVKVIIESGLLRKEQADGQKIVEACICCIIAGVDFVKTSTGFLGTGASVEDVSLMYRCVHAFGMHVKASGGIRTKEDAMKMVQHGATRIGASKGVSIVGGNVTAKEGGY